MKNLDMKICNCGRIHFYSNSLLDKILDDEKELVIICSNCGDTIHIGANKEIDMYAENDDEGEHYCYNMYAYIQKNEVITKESFNKRLNSEKGHSTIGQIIVDEGVGVPMETGYNASYRTPDGFADYNSHFELTKKYETVEEITKAMEEYDNKRHQVRMDELIKRLDDAEAETLSKYYIKDLDWTGTKWQKY